jgi:hypothetical protein
MATVTLRPVADISLKHSCSSGSSGYAMINEATADDDSTYIYQNITSTDTTTVTSQFKLGGTLANKGKIKIESIDVYVDLKTTRSSIVTVTDYTEFYITVNGATGSTETVSMNSLRTDYTVENHTYTASSFGIGDTEFSSLDDLTINLSLSTRGKASGKNSSFNLRITQIYAIVTYTESHTSEATGLYVKVDGAYREVQAVYKKISGAWVQQTDISSLFSTTGKYKLKEASE